jgi:hypothetical protein
MAAAWFFPRGLEFDWPSNAEGSSQTGVDEGLNFLGGSNSSPPGLLHKVKKASLLY